MADRNSSTNAPKRRWQLTLDLHADSADELADALRSIAFDGEIDGFAGDRTSGGSRSGYHLTVTEDQSVTAESYREALVAYVAAKKIPQDQSDA